MKIEIMHAVLAIGALLIMFSFWRAHKNHGIDFDLLDLLKQNGRASKVSVIIMGAFIMSTWVVANRELSGTLTADFFGLYLAAWVSPLITLLATSNSEPPGTTSTSTTVMRQETTEKAST
jgi:hypothetical protein